MGFAKAFDKVPHRRLLHKLTYYGVNMKTTAWINSFIENRNHNVILEGAKSTSAFSHVRSATRLGVWITVILDIHQRHARHHQTL